MEPKADEASEYHEKYDQSNAGEADGDEPYDPNDVWVLEVNNRNKVKSIKKLILEKIKLFKKANILIFKKNPTPQIVSDSQPAADPNVWVPLNDHDNE